MEQRARVMGKTAEAAGYRKYIEKMKKKTKRMNENKHGFECPPGYKFDSEIMQCVPVKSRFKTLRHYTYFLSRKDISSDQQTDQLHCVHHPRPVILQYLEGTLPPRNLLRS